MKKAKTDFEVVVEDLFNANEKTLHLQQILLYFITQRSQTVSKKLRLQAEHYDITYHLIVEITNIRRNKGELQLLLKGTGLNDKAEHTWETIAKMCEVIPGLLEDFLHTAGMRNIKRKTPDLYYK